VASFRINKGLFSTVCVLKLYGVDTCCRGSMLWFIQGYCFGYQQTSHLSHSVKFCGSFGTSAVLGTTPGSLMSQHNTPYSVGRCPQVASHSTCHISYLTPPIGEFLSNLESKHHKLPDVHGLKLATPSLRGREAFSTPKAPTHTRITCALSHMAPHKSRCHSRIPIVLMMLRAFFMERCTTLIEA
jgi:hypothetical protein